MIAAIRWSIEHLEILGIPAVLSSLAKVNLVLNSLISVDGVLALRELHWTPLALEVAYSQALFKTQIVVHAIFLPGDAVVDSGFTLARVGLSQGYQDLENQFHFYIF